MIRLSRFALIAAGFLATTACTDPAVAEALTKINDRLDKIEEGQAAGGANAAAAANAEQEALDLYKKGREAMGKGDNAEAKKLFEQLVKDYSGSRAAQAAQRVLAELSVVGKEISELEVEEWYQGETTLGAHDTTLLVFWEVWCPHCKREVPKLQETYTKYEGKGLGVVGLTKLSRGKTKEDVDAFIKEQGVGYPIAKETGTMSDFFGVSGVPAAAVVKGGEVVWRGHPAQLTDAQIEGWL